jgi:hypothetical protein
MSQTHALPTGTVAADPHPRHLGAAVLAVLVAIAVVTILFVTLALAGGGNDTPAPPVVREAPTWNTPNCPLHGIC